MRSFIVTFLLAMFCHFPRLPSQEFADDFNRPDGPASGWVTSLGTAQIVSEEYLLQSEFSEVWTWIDGTTFNGDLTIEFEVRFAPAGSNPDIGRHGGIMFFASEPSIRWSSTMNGYTLDWIDREFDHGYRFHKWVNGSESSMAPEGTVTDPDPGASWKITISGDEMTVEIDGIELFSATDGDFREGYLGFWAYSNGQTMFVDNVRVGEGSPGAPGGTGLVSVSSLGVQGNEHSGIYRPVISANGRYAAFESQATNLVPGDENHLPDVFVRDLETGKTSRVSVGKDGEEANGLSAYASISGSGRYVAFYSTSTNLTEDSPSSGTGIYLFDRQTAKTELLDPSGVFPSISADGNRVAFVGGTPGAAQVHLRDRALAETLLVSRNFAGQPGNDHSSGHPDLSGRGRFVAFESVATNLVPGDTNGVGDIFVRDLQAGLMTRESVSSTGGEANGLSDTPRISADGRFVVFRSLATNLDAKGLPGLFLRDREKGVAGRVASTRHFDDLAPSISANGRFIAFDSSVPRLPKEDANFTLDVFVYDVQTGQMALASPSIPGMPLGIGNSFTPSLSADGKSVVFQSGAWNLVDGDTNLERDIFVHVVKGEDFDEDRDGDGIPTVWETQGIDDDGDGHVDLDLTALGADPDHKDLFVEVDAMAERVPLPEVLDRVAAAFADVPAESVINPDGQKGINLHAELDESDIPLGDFPGDFDEFDLIKAERFGTPLERSDPNWTAMRAAKSKVYRYGLFANTHANTGSSGLAELPGNDFMVTLGHPSWPTTGGDPDQQAGTFMHELGHNLGLRHGGADSVNFKPNFHSVMNYVWQFPEHKAYRPTGWQLDYSREEWPALDENQLDEAAGIGGHAGHMVPVGPPPLRMVNEKGAVDWNQDGDTGDLVTADINYFGGGSGPPSPGEVLQGHNDWANLRYELGGDPNFAEGIHTSTTADDELTVKVLDVLDQAFQANTFRRGDANGDGLVDIADAVKDFAYLFLGDSGPACLDAGDANDDGEVDISDGIRILFWLFAEGHDIPAPGAKACGPDPSTDDLPVCQYDPKRC